ncbi:uncharacterized protein [Ambystoma mexicanum]|uniref:uncharacterized protein isoform X2 n=1 Tax=Ambystoma mexicanum TaxID=8296 RepID=UPI0037E7FDAC
MPDVSEGNPSLALRLCLPYPQEHPVTPYRQAPAPSPHLSGLFIIKFKIPRAAASAPAAAAHLSTLHSKLTTIQCLYPTGTMLRLLGVLLALTAGSLAAECPAPCKVVAGVFQTNTISVNYSSAQEACACYNATIASLEQVSIARNQSYESCSWGWVKEQKIVMPRVKVNAKCGLNLTGVVNQMPCVYLQAESGFCFKGKGLNSTLYMVFPPNGSQLLSKTDAKNLCVSLGGNLATTAEMTEVHLLQNLTGTGWCQEGIVTIGPNSTVEKAPCVNYPNVAATVFCYNPKSWKKIVMGCILASIFIVLLTAALCMRGNQFICCLEKAHPVNRDLINEVRREAPGAPTWNKTGVYRPVTEMIDPLYCNSGAIIPEPRRPAIRPEMFIYRSHLLSGLPNPVAAQALPHSQSHTYDNLGYSTAGDE